MPVNPAPASPVWRAKLAATDLEEHFDTVVVSGEVGVGKPDEKVFRIVLDELEVQADRAVMVGDSLSSDIAGARLVAEPVMCAMLMDCRRSQLERRVARRGTSRWPQAEFDRLSKRSPENP